MPANGSTGPNGSPSVTELVSGIVGDVQDLGMQHLALFRSEIKEDIRRTTQAASSLGMGLAVAEIGGILLGLMLVHVLIQFAPNLSTWVCYGIVGLAFALIGVIAIMNGVTKLKSIETPRQTAEIIKEDAQWLTNSK